MPHVTRRGFTLVELVVGVVLLGIVSAGIYKVLITNQRTYTAQTQRIDLQQNIRAGATILPGEFREMNAVAGDIQVFTPTEIKIRAMRQLGFICVAPVLGGGLGQISMTVRAQPIFGNRQTLAVNDSVLVFFDGNPLTRNDDGWLRAEIKSVADQACPDPGGARPGFVVAMDPNWLGGTQQNVAGGITNGSPVRVFQMITYKVYQGSDGEWYLGQRIDWPPGGSIQPLIGPLIGSNGVQFRYLNAAGTPVADSSQIALIEIRLRGRTASKIAQASAPGVDYMVDSIVTRVALRGNTRCNVVAGSPCL
jgi:prepilin-type N-terminal cleavage/methylation domain-containing protein